MTLTRRGLADLRRTAAALEGSPALQEQVIGYILRTYQDVDLDALGDAGASRMEGIMGTVAETLRAEGRAEFLVHLLESRFGPLPLGLRSRIAGAEPTQLDGWFDRGPGAWTRSSGMDDPGPVSEWQGTPVMRPSPTHSNHGMGTSAAAPAAVTVLSGRDAETACMMGDASACDVVARHGHGPGTPRRRRNRVRDLRDGTVRSQ